MKTIALYRGIAVPKHKAKSISDFITSKGIIGDEGIWKFSVPDFVSVRTQLEYLYEKPDLTINDFYEETPFLGICACGSSVGAEYYASKHNLSLKNNHPIVIEFYTDLDLVAIDTRDFLCPAFQLWDRYSKDYYENQAKLLSELYGEGVLRYFHSACQVTEQKFRIAMCNLAAYDPEVILSHYSNQKIIEGRWGVLFTSAFFVQGPVPPDRIKKIYHVHSYQPPIPYISLNKFISGDNAIFQ